MAETDNRPLRARVYEKELTALEQSIILAMLEIGDDTGQYLYSSVPRIAAYAKLDEKTVQRALWGDHRKHPDQPRPKREKGQPDKECPFCPDCLISRRVLEPLAPANWKERRAARYRLNLEILDDSEAVRRYLDQKKLKVPRAEKGPPQRPARPSDPRSLVPRPMVASPSDPRSHDSEPLDSKAIDSRAKPTSSSAIEDDVELVDRVILAFEASPVTTGKANGKDRDLARQLLSPYTPEQIENGITLGTARKMCSEPSEHSKVRSLAYFTDPIAEAAADPNLTPEYLERCKRLTDRLQRKSEGVA